ncbi:MAG: hypothetical protein AAGJ18_20270, partial [Bacteroidota bacterium]
SPVHAPTVQHSKKSKMTINDLRKYFISSISELRDISLLKKINETLRSNKSMWKGAPIKIR